MRAHLDAHGRDPATFTTSKRVFIGVEDDPETALRRMQPWFTMHSGSGQRAERVGVYGTPEQCAEGLAEIAGTALASSPSTPSTTRRQAAASQRGPAPHGLSL